MIPGQVGIYLCTVPVDMRYGFDRLCQLLREHTMREPQSGGLFVFANKRATRLKILWFERNGCCLLYKRLHRARFELPLGEDSAMVLSREQLARLLEGKEQKSRRRSKDLTAKPIVCTSGVREEHNDRGDNAQSA